MKAMVLHKTGKIENGPLVWSDVPIPQPGDGEVRLKVHCCAICRTDLHVIEGDLPEMKRPVIPGHQIVGTVDALGPSCKRMRIGQRIGVAWLRHTCGVCHFCTSGRENLCIDPRFTGYHADGGYAEYAVVPEAFAYELPENWGDDVAISPLLCAGIIGFRSLLRCNLRPGGRLGLFGFGSSAHIVLQLARHRGHEVYVVSRGEGHRALAKSMGAAWCSETTQGMPGRLDAAIVFAPVGTIVPEALAVLDRGGVVSLAGIHMSPIPPLDYDKLLYGERDIHPVTANTRQDGRDLLTEAAAADVHPHTRVYELRDANRALADMKEDRIDGTGVLMVDDFIRENPI